MARFGVHGATLVAATLILGLTPAFAQIVDTRMWMPNGVVDAVARGGNTIYVAGVFNRFGPYTGAGVPVSEATGAVSTPFPKVESPVFPHDPPVVNAVIPDGSGGWYIGGSFVSVGGVSHANAAHILADGSVAAWDPNPNGAIDCLAMVGGTLFVGGEFTHIGGQARNHIGEVDAVTGAATPWDPNADGTVTKLAANAGTVYVVGAFSTIGSQARNRIAAIDAATGAVTAWNPNPNASSSVYALALGNGKVYVGGSFTSIGGQPRKRIAALDSSTSDATGWNPNANGNVGALTPVGDVVFASGLFDSVGDQPHDRLAALDAVTGAPTAWNPHLGAEGGVGDMEWSGDRLYLAGVFTSVGGQARNGIAAVDTSSGSLIDWDPVVFGDAVTGTIVRDVAASGGSIYLAGSFKSVGGVRRNNLVAVDATTGMATSWNPNADKEALALAVSGNTVYVGGAFLNIGGQPRRCLAAVDAATGAVTSWDPHPNGPLNSANSIGALTVDGDKLYAGGGFTKIGAVSRSNVAAFDVTSGALTPWHPTVGGSVHAIASGGGLVYVGGRFQFAGVPNEPRFGIAAVDTATGALSSWNPGTDGAAFALARSGNEVFVGGDFQHIGQANRRGFAVLDASSGLATWDPGIIEQPYAFLIDGPTLYAGGTWNSPDFLSAYQIAAIDIPSHTISWEVTGDGGNPVKGLALNGSALYAGGYFLFVDGLPWNSFAAIDVDAPTPALLSLVSAEASTDRVHLTWLATDRMLLAATVYRRTESEAWSAVGRVSANGSGRIEWEDAGVSPGSRYGYRLGIVESGRERFLGETWVDVPRTLELALQGSRPNPARQDLTLAFTLPSASPARIEVLDVAGRLRVARDVGALGPGNHVLRLAEGRGLEPGLYLLRLTQEKISRTARVTVVR